MAENNICKYCKNPCDPYKGPALTCSGDCRRKVHINCLKCGSVPGSLAGDVFFTFVCTECSPLQKELLHREQLSWQTVIILTLYNLREKSSGISKRGYFHWKSDISTFIEKNWDWIFPKGKKKKKYWIGTISGTLSHSRAGVSPLFKSGTSELGECGWWKLINNDPPEVLVKKSERKRKKSCSSPIPPSKTLSSAEHDLHTPFMPAEIPSELLLPDDDDIPEVDFLGIDFDMNWDFTAPLLDDDDIDEDDEEEEEDDDDDDDDDDEESVDCWMDGDKPSEDSATKNQIDATATNTTTTSNTTAPVYSRQWPWRRNQRLMRRRPPMSKQEEEYLLQNISKAHLDSMTVSARRLYRKLAVRKAKRDNNLGLFNLNQGQILGEKRVIDRFLNDDENTASVEHRLQGFSVPTFVHSPYTNRLLKPFIRRDTACRPLWLQLMSELLFKVNKNTEYTIESIDYCYVRPQHIPAINSLCRKFFWPGIDMSECLEYPDFTCVVLYKKLIVGFAALVPDETNNTAYISFFVTRPEWRKAGIGTFMLYHLIQTCMGKDITLHVSATNPALILYQKFGFKVEEFVQDFYDKYLSSGPKESRHALFLRLTR